MGISAVVWAASDDILLRFARAPETFAAWAADPAVKRLRHSLLDEWRSLDGLLASIAPRPGLPWSALVEGDLAYPTIGDRGAHGLRSSTVDRLGAVVAGITRADVEAFARQSWAEFAGRTGRHPELTATQLAIEVDRLWGSLAGLRRVVDAAKSAGLGFVIARWEDW